MAYRPPVAVYDACVLYPFHLRNILVQCAFDGLIEARWTDDIHDEWIRNLLARTPGLTLKRLEATRDRMKSVLPSADVKRYRGLISGLRLPDPGDRHVLAAAVAGKATVIVTRNVKHFPDADLSAYGIICQQPDDFLTEIHGDASEALIASMANARRNLRKSVPSIDEFIATVEDQGLRNTAGILRRHKADLV
jgi:predicted nucleic acid-binding protein